MLPESAAATGGTLTQTPRRRSARLVQGLSLVTFLAAAACMLLAGALHSAGRAGTSSTLATLGYALGVAGITAGVLALALEPSTDPQPRRENP
jgi:hypothetical protein